MLSLGGLDLGPVLRLHHPRDPGLPPIAEVRALQDVEEAALVRVRLRRLHGVHQRHRSVLHRRQPIRSELLPSLCFERPITVEYFPF